MGVSRLIGKLFGGDSGRNEALLRAYGKLPIYAEYRRLELSPGTPTAFSQWVDAGRLAWVRSPSRTEKGATRPSRLLIGLPGAKEAVIASVWESRDSLGRVFPFTFFVVCPHEVLGDDPVERWVVAADVCRSFDRLYARLHSLGSGGDFYRFYHKCAIRLRPDDLGERVALLREQAANIAADTWYDGLALDGDIPAETWFDGLVRRARRWQVRPGPPAQLAISCPLASGVSGDVQAILWLEWLGGLLKKVGRPPWMLVSGENERAPAALHLMARDLLAEDYQLLTTDDRTYGYVEHLAAVPPAETDPPAPAAERPAGSLLDWLKDHQV